MKIVIIGGGMMSRAITHDLINFQDAKDLVIIDNNETNLKLFEALYNDSVNLRLVHADARNNTALHESVGGASIMLSCVPYQFNIGLLETAITHHLHFIDLGGNNDIVDKQFLLGEKAAQAGTTALPACGLAPGAVSIMAAEAMNRLTAVDNIRMYCGGLPARPKEPLKYQIVFSPHGLINEYIEPADVIENYKIKSMPALNGLEILKFDPAVGKLEAFMTSGGAGTLVRTLKGSVRSLSYKTLRYPGHRDMMKAMLDLGFASETPVELPGIHQDRDAVKVSPRNFFEAILARMLPGGAPDIVVTRVTAEGLAGDSPASCTIEFIDHADSETGLSAMMRCTGFSAAVIAGMIIRDEIKKRGVLAVEQAVPSTSFIDALKKRGIPVKESFKCKTDKR